MRIWAMRVFCCARRSSSCCEILLCCSTARMTRSVDILEYMREVGVRNSVSRRCWRFSYLHHKAHCFIYSLTIESSRFALALSLLAGSPNLSVRPTIDLLPLILPVLFDVTC